MQEAEIITEAGDVQSEYLTGLLLVISYQRSDSGYFCGGLPN